MIGSMEDELFMLKAENDSIKYEISMLREEMSHMWTTLLLTAGFTILVLVGSGLGWW